MSNLKGAAAELFVERLTYMHKAATDPAGIAEVVKTPPASIKGDAAKEWKRVAPALAKMGRLGPRQTVALHGYCHAYGSWREIQRMRKRDGAWEEFERERHSHLKQMARMFGFFPSDNGGMNLDQPLPLTPRKKKHMNDENFRR